MGAGNRMLQGRIGRNQYDITKENMDDLSKQFEMKNALAAIFCVKQTI
jgi:hypothetical protein